MQLYQRLKNQFPELELCSGFPFSRHTSIGCGGTASVAASPKTAAQTAELLAYLQEEHIAYCFLGAGANVLPCDGDFEGVVVCFHRLNTYRLEGDILIAGAGVTGGALCRFAKEHGAGGFEPFAGIPMTVGGATVMNAGVAECHISDLLEYAVAIENGKMRVFSLDECRFSEKYSVFQQKIAVVKAAFRTQRRTSVEIQKRTKYFLDKRKSLPKGRSMGCVFVNPTGMSAGKLIDECGLKGMRIGGAYVSPLHANFIINEESCAQDIDRLIQAVKSEVLAKTGILLREEIKRIPDDLDTY